MMRYFIIYIVKIFFSSTCQKPQKTTNFHVHVNNKKKYLHDIIFMQNDNNVMIIL